MEIECSKLKSCPFCGCDEIDVAHHEVNGFLEHVFVGCTSCGVGYTEAHHEEAVEAWNCRPEEDVLPEEDVPPAMPIHEGALDIEGCQFYQSPCCGGCHLVLIYDCEGRYGFMCEGCKKIYKIRAIVDLLSSDLRLSWKMDC